MSTFTLGLKAIAQIAGMMMFPGWGGQGGYGTNSSAPIQLWRRVMPRTTIDYAAEVGDGSGSAVVMAPVLWIARTFPESPFVVRDANQEILPSHPLTRLIARPNPHYGGNLLWMATLIDFVTTGNAYWIKVRAATRQPVQIFWAPQWMMQPRWPADGSAFLSHYEYKPNNVAKRFDPADVVHFRYGLDPANTRCGLSPLASLFREIFTDDEAANFSAALLRNLGIPGVIIAPSASDVELLPEDADRIKADFQNKFSGDKRGQPMVLSTPTKVEVVGFNPQQMDLKVLRRIPEERVSAVLGVPAVVSGLGAGLDRSTYNNMKEAREMAYESNIIPTQRLLAGDLNVHLLPDFGDPNKEACGFDLSQVRVLQDDQDKLYDRMNKGVLGGYVSIAEARRATGFDTLPADEVFLRPRVMIPVAVGERQTVAATPLPTAPLAPGGDAGSTKSGPFRLDWQGYP